MALDRDTGVYYELHGPANGVPLLIGLPLMASHVQIFGAASAALLEGYLGRLTDRYRVLLLDYPSIGRSREIPPESLTADRVCSDLLSVATAADFERFAYWGYSWGGAVGLQLATRSQRLAALVIGGWPPLGAPYAGVLAASRARIGRPEPSSMVVLRNVAQYAQWSHYYASTLDWPEAEAVAAISCPRMVFFGSEGDIEEASHPIRIASIIRERRQELERLGWRVHEIMGYGHGVVLEPALVVPAVRAFLDARIA